MADTFCAIMDAGGFAKADPNNVGSSAKRSVAKVCLNPSTLQVISAEKVQLSEGEIQQMQQDFSNRMRRRAEVRDCKVVGSLCETLVEGLADPLRASAQRAAKGAPTTPKTSEKKEEAKKK